MSEKNRKIDFLLKEKEKIQEKRIQFFFYVPDTEGKASGAVIELYNLVRVLRENGYDAKLVTERTDYKVPTWLDDELQQLPHVATNDEKNPIRVGVSDWLVIPEYFTNVMKQVDSIQCNKMVLAQSYDFTITSLLPGTTWKSLFKIQNVLTTSKKLADFIQKAHSLYGAYNIKTFKIHIPDYFKPNPIKKPTISIFARNSADISKLVNLFYLLNPQYAWIDFKDLRGTTRREFAKILGDTFATVWIDRIAGFGQTPLEAMKAKSIPVCLVPDMQPEYMTENNGVYSNNIYDLAALLGKVCDAWVQDSVHEGFWQSVNETVSQYSRAESDKSIMAAFGEFISEQLSQIDTALQKIEETDSFIESEAKIVNLNQQNK